MKRSGFTVFMSICAGFGVMAEPMLPSHSARALELRGSSYFTRPPWKVTLRSYHTTVSQPAAKYYFTVDLPLDAGAALGGLSIRQTRGVDTRFQFNPGRSRAFLGRPREEGPDVPVEVTFNASERLLQAKFPEPVPPGSTLTLMVKPWANPAKADTYLFQVTALPAGPNPVGASLGVGTLRIYQSEWH